MLVIIFADIVNGVLEWGIYHAYLQALRNRRPMQPLRNWMSPVLRTIYFRVRPLEMAAQCVNADCYRYRRHCSSCCHQWDRIGKFQLQCCGFFSFFFECFLYLTWVILCRRCLPSIWCHCRQPNHYFVHPMANCGFRKRVPWVPIWHCHSCDLAVTVWDCLCRLRMTRARCRLVHCCSNCLHLIWIFLQQISLVPCVRFEFQHVEMDVEFVTLTVGGVVFGAFSIFHRRCVVVVVLQCGKIGSGYLWHVTDDIWTVVVSIVRSLAFQWQLFRLTGIVTFTAQCSCCSGSTAQQLMGCTKKKIGQC